MKFKPFPELTDILLLEQCETSGEYRHIELDGGESKCWVKVDACYGNRNEHSYPFLT